MRAALLFPLLLPASLFAQPRTTADARLDSARITVGSPVRLTLEVHHRPMSGSLQWPLLADTFNRLEVLRRGTVDTLSDGENAVYRQEILLTGFDSVRTTVPPLIFAVRPEIGAPYAVTTQPLPLLVATLPVDTTRPFRPIRDIVETPAGGFHLSGRWLFLLAGLALLGLAAGSALYMRAQRQRKAAGGQQHTALEKLDALRAEGLLQRGAVKEHYTRLSDILRDEVALRCKVPTRQRPTGEILLAVKDALNEAALGHLRRALTAADAVKFAKACPAEVESEATMAEAREALTQIAAP